MDLLEMAARLEGPAREDAGALVDMFEVVRLIEAERDKRLAHDWNKAVRAIATDRAATLGCERSYELLKRSLLFDALEDLDAYLQYLEFDRDPEKRFYLPRRRHLRPLVDGLQQLHDGDLFLLTLSLPPGIGKTTLAIFYLSWQMGLHPGKPNLASAHSDKLTRSIYDGVVTLLSDPEYLWGDVFTQTTGIETNAKDETIDVGTGGGRRRFKTLTCRSIDGSLTGATRCENLLYSDDLVSGIEEALSRERMDTLWTKYSNDLKSRKKQGCKELHIATRWSVHDPIGRLEQLYGDAPGTRFIKQPALNLDGESNFDYLGGVGFDTRYFLDMKETLDDISWRCLFQQEPIEREGLLYPEDEMRTYYELPTEEPDAVVAICDTAEGGGDDTFLPVAYLYGEDAYIEDCVCDPGLPEVTAPLCAEMLLRHKVKRAQFESNAAGGGFADKVQDILNKKAGITHITKRRTTANKLTKIIVNSDWVKKHCLFKVKYQPNSAYGRMMKLLCGFTVMGKAKHDDVPDGMAQLAEMVQGLKGAEITVFKRPW